MTTEASSTETQHLRRELHLWEAVGISLALMAPSMAANINPQGTADTGVGRAVPLAFALATIGVLLIAWTFVRLTQQHYRRRETIKIYLRGCDANGA
jgi:amino acid transporter